MNSAQKNTVLKPLYEADKNGTVSNMVFIFCRMFKKILNSTVEYETATSVCKVDNSLNTTI